MTHDKHLGVAVTRKAPEKRVTNAAAADEARGLDVRRSNSGVRKIEILPGNIGLLDLSFFYRPEKARDALVGAMHVLSRADALILDMRMKLLGNNGGN